MTPTNLLLDNNKATHINVPQEDCSFHHHFVLPTPTVPVEGQPAPVELITTPEHVKVVSDAVAKDVSRAVDVELNLGMLYYSA